MTAMDRRFTTWKPLIDTFLEMNNKINLSAIRDEQWIYTKHILDSLELVSLDVIQSGMRVCDVGTWWWFPLIPLAMWYPRTQFVWLDSTAKKLVAIDQMVQSLWINTISTVWSRSENHRVSYDLVTARAVSYIDAFLSNTSHLIASWWLLVLYKEQKTDEYQDMITILWRYNLILECEHQYTLFAGDIQRVLYVLRKK